MNVEELLLEHSGVKGMKWGVRKKRGRSSTDYKKTAPYRNKHPKELTNRQLRVVNERINLEQNYRRLNPSTVHKGQSMVKEALAIAATGAALYKVLNGPVGKRLIDLGKKAVVKKDLTKIGNSLL